MFQFIHAADIHLDSPLRGLALYESAPAEAIRGACRAAFVKLIDLAIEEKVAFVLLAGDLYDGDLKDFNSMIFLNQQIGRLAKFNIQVFLVYGNHDAENRMTKALKYPPNMKIFSSNEAETEILAEYRVAIHGQSFKEKKVTDNLSLNYPRSMKNFFNIGLLHTSLDGREGHANYAPCSKNDLENKDYQYWALGHVHKQEIVSKDPYIVYPGCIQGRHIKETEAKGCFLVTVENEEVCSLESKELDVFRWYKCEICVDQMLNIEQFENALRKDFSAYLNLADGRSVALRLEIIGQCAFRAQITAYPERLALQVKAIAAEIAGEEIWIEKIINKTRDKVNLEDLITNHDLIGPLLKDMLQNEEKNLEGIQQIILDLEKKLPIEAIDRLNMKDEDFKKVLLTESKKMLIARILS